MVPDVHHILAKGGGVFCAPASAAHPPKLRLLFEAAPMAFVVEAAGGASSDGDGAQSLLVRAKRSGAMRARMHASSADALSTALTRFRAPLQEQRVLEPEQRTAVCLGSREQVAQCAEAMRGGVPPK